MIAKYADRAATARANRARKIAREHRVMAAIRRREASEVVGFTEEYGRLMYLVGFHSIQADQWERSAVLALDTHIEQIAA